jgi:apolipoprotein N-acyltransferase
MFRDHRQDKRAEFLVNITNDGWYKFNQMPQHLQVAVFRSIENRVPTARSVNTGISGFVDSLGRTHDLIAAGKTGSAHAVLQLDRRVTFYTRVGDIFAGICLAATTLLAAFLAWRAWRGNLGVSASRGR